MTSLALSSQITTVEATKAARESGEKHQEQLASELQGSKLELAELSVCLPCFCMEPLVGRLVR